MKLQLRPVHEQVVVVMGASSGIGRAAALRFAERGAAVVVSARSAPGLESLVAEITARGGRAEAVVADVSDAAQVQSVADAALSAYGRIDTWVNLAGVALFASFEHTTAEEFRRVVEVNLLGQVHGAMVALPHLRRGGGSLICVSSMGAKRGIPLQTAYCASKHGIDGFVESLRAELRHDKAPVSLTQIMPATINTPLFDNARTKLGVKPTAPPPVYQPRVVVEAVLHAAEHPVRDIIVGGAARALILTESVAPRLLDAVLSTVGYRLHYTKDPKPDGAPDNLYEPLTGHDSAEGTIGDRALSRSLYTRWALATPLRSVITLAGDTVAAAGTRVLGGQRVRQSSSGR
jgi:NAD(P)-dependent dehydrogenase (short-subunit alcohol dehydrogenase family)